jgi:hypothetical protein
VPGFVTLSVTVTAWFAIVRLVTESWINTILPGATIEGVTAAVTSVPAKALDASNPPNNAVNTTFLTKLFFIVKLAP